MTTRIANELASAVGACRQSVEDSPLLLVPTAPRAELEGWLSAYADEQTSLAESAYLQAHLSTCEACRSRVQYYAETRSILQQAYNDAWIPPDLRLRVALACRVHDDYQSAAHGY